MNRFARIKNTVRDYFATGGRDRLALRHTKKERLLRKWVESGGARPLRMRFFAKPFVYAVHIEYESKCEGS